MQAPEKKGPSIRIDLERIIMNAELSSDEMRKLCTRSIKATVFKYQWLSVNTAPR